MLSLVVGSLGRSEELANLLQSLQSQPFRDFELIVVDQNDDDRLVPIVKQYEGQFPIRHLRSTVRNISHARNLGLEAARGNIVGFPDDDCLYLPDTMERVVRRFDEDPSLAILAGNHRSPEGGLVNGRWNSCSCAIADRTVWTTVMGSSLWTRTAPAREVGGFDPAVGPGTPWGSAEEPDFVLRLMRRGYRGYYDYAIGVLHPEKRLTAAAIARAFLYGAGMGRVLRRHAIAPSIVLPYFIRPIGGLLLSLLQARPGYSRYYWGTLRGRLFGYTAPLAR